MSIRINLLPWREARRGRRTRHFYAWVALMLVLGGGLGWLMAQVYQHKLAVQLQRNTFISDQMARLNADIEEVASYQRSAAHLREQLTVFQALESQRLDTLQLFNDVAESVVDGVIYQQLSKTGNRISVTGIAENERQVFEQLRSIAEQPGLGVPSLSAMESDPQGAGRVFRFSVEQKALDIPPGALASDSTPASQRGAQELVP
ncbi:MAG: fimbrial assembly protein [Halomonas sp.]|nr:PilN domain-containing protein [Halomonas sp.]TVP46279.1 MAG: fimbrial assembly protein [Halomonas sp.]